MTEEITVDAEPRRRSPLRRVGCWIVIVIWFLILLLPCALIMLAVQQEIVITTGSAPGQQLRLWLISEAEQRGFGLSTASVIPKDNNDLCVQTDVRFFLWAGKGESSSYCDCYQRANQSAAWTSVSTATGACSG